MLSMDALTFWIVAGIFLLILEMLTGGFFLLFISIGCFASVLAYALGCTLNAQILVCAAVSILGVGLFRKPIQRRLLKKIELTADVGKEIQADQPIGQKKQARNQ
jgi:membrane protein implicated in regulation of membrane protease activity